MRGDTVLAIVGPTASGKSALADELACRLHTAQVSVDAMQVYRGMNIGTAKTPVAERVCPLLMVDVADIGENYSVQLYQAQARACIDKLQAAGKVPVLCGGTGLYLNAVIDDMVFPKGDTESPTRKIYETRAEVEGADGIWELLHERDPESAALIHPHNVRRVIRALELLDEGTSYARQHEGLHKRKAWYHARIYGISLDRAHLYERIDQRVEQMFDKGLVQEVQGLVDKGLGSALTSLQAIGYKELLQALNGEITLEEAQALIKRHTRRYAKRQLSWFHHDPRVTWLDMETLTQKDALNKILEDKE